MSDEKRKLDVTSTMFGPPPKAPKTGKKKKTAAWASKECERILIPYEGPLTRGERIAACLVIIQQAIDVQLLTTKNHLASSARMLAKARAKVQQLRDQVISIMTENVAAIDAAKAEAMREAAQAKCVSLSDWCLMRAAHYDKESTK